MSVLARYFSSRRRLPTSSSSPRRLWWSCWCTLRCSVRSLIRRVSSATWTSGEPVSPSVVACSAMISFFTAFSSGTWLLQGIRSVSWEPPHTAVKWSPGPPHEGAAKPAGNRRQRFTLSRGQQLPGLVDVTVHLGDQVLDGVEAFGAAQAGGEVDGHVGAVQVQVVPVQGVGLDRALVLAEGGVGADRDRGGPAAVGGAVRVQAEQPAGVDAVPRYGRVRR